MIGVENRDGITVRHAHDCTGQRFSVSGDADQEYQGEQVSEVHFRSHHTRGDSLAVFPWVRLHS